MNGKYILPCLTKLEALRKISDPEKYVFFVCLTNPCIFGRIFLRKSFEGSRTKNSANKTQRKRYQKNFPSAPNSNIKVTY